MEEYECEKHFYQHSLLGELHINKKRFVTLAFYKTHRPRLDQYTHWKILLITYFFEGYFHDARTVVEGEFKYMNTTTRFARLPLAHQVVYDCMCDLEGEG